MDADDVTPMMPTEWAQIGHALPVQRDWRQEPFERERPLDPQRLAEHWVGLARRFDDEAREARECARNCREYAAELRGQ